MMILISLEGFSENPKNWSFRWLRTCEKSEFLLFSQFFIFFIQMSTFLDFRCPDVNTCDSHQFRRLFRKSQKLKFSMTVDLWKKWIFAVFTIFHFFFHPNKWIFRFLVVLMSIHDDSHQFRRLFRKSQKLKFSMTADLWKKVIFFCFHNFSFFSSKWVNF